MKIEARTTSPESLDIGCLVVAVCELDGLSSGRLGALNRYTGGALERALSTGDFSGKVGTRLELYASGEGPRRLLFVGLGSEEELNSEKVRRQLGQAGKLLRDRKDDSAALDLSALPGEGELRAERIVAACEGLALATYRYVRRSRDLEHYPVFESLLLLDGTAGEALLERAAAYAEATIDGTSYARDLAAMPAMDLYPEAYGELAGKLASDKIRVEVLGVDRLKELGMGALLAVGQGSARPPALIHLSYDPGDLPDDAKTIALVGKGITFDSGGIDLKSASGMRWMKIDMAGSATVMGVFKAIERIAPRCRVEGFIPAAENMTGANAFRPGDVLTSYRGLTIEIDNTDAEGRLALADGLAYAVDTVKPDAILDIATLTGACMIALGHHASGLVGNSDEIEQRLVEASEPTGELVWRLPLWDDYRDQIKSEIADIKNTGGRPGGAITAAAFLEHFVGETPWMHIDIAGTAFEVSRSYVPHKELPSGAAVRLLLEALRNWS